MTGFVIHHCPKCELRYSFRSELEHHLSVDHPVRPVSAPATVQVDEAPVSVVIPAAPPVAHDRHGDATRRPHAIGLVVAFAAVLLLAWTAVFVSLPTTVLLAVVLLTFVGIYVRRARGRPRLPRR